MEASLRHFVQYDMEGNSSVAAIAESLVANERLAKEAALLFEALVPGLIIESATVTVRRVVQESPLQQAFVVALVAAFQPRLERDVPQIVTDLTGIVIPDRYHTLLTILVMLVAVYGISKAIELLFPGRSKDDLDKNYRNLVVVAGDLIQAPSNEVDTAIRARYSGKKLSQVTSLVRGFFSPTAGRAHAQILAPDGTAITPLALVEIPQLAIPQPVEDAEKMDTQFEYNKRIIIHAMDRDRSKLGWAAHIPSLFADRVPMKLDKTIDPQSLFTKRQVTGDVLIVYKIDEAENRIPSEIHLLRIKEPAGKSKKKG
jgi:hypothetical protein